MTRHPSAAVGSLIAAGLAAAMLRPPAAIAASGLALDSSQIDAGYLADVSDLKTAVTYSSADDRTDVSLALVPPKPAGGPGITLLFRARFRGRTVDVSRLDEILLRAHYTLHSDDRTRAAAALSASHALRMNIDPQDPGGISLDFFPSNWGYSGFAPPGDEIPVAYFSVTTADLRALALARSITGEVLWTRFTLATDEIAALRQFAQTVLPPAPSSR